MATTKTMERDDGWMPNRGFPPDAELVTIKYRCGVIARCVRPDQRRWKQWPTGPHGWDIVSWQLSTGKDYEVVFNGKG